MVLICRYEHGEAVLWLLWFVNDGLVFSGIEQLHGDCGQRADWVLDFCEDGAGKWWSYVGRADGKRTVDRCLKLCLIFPFPFLFLFILSFISDF